MAAPAQPLMAAPAPDILDSTHPVDIETFESMTAGLLEHIHASDQRRGLIEALRKAKDPAIVAGDTTMLLVKNAAEQAIAAEREFDLDLLLGVATELIDAILKIARAAKVRIGDEDDFRTAALFRAVQAYQLSTPPGSEEQEAAKAMLAEMQANGMVQEGAAELQRLGQKAGVDPFAQAEPKEKPMAQGVRAGLMAQGMPQ